MPEDSPGMELRHTRMVKDTIKKIEPGTVRPFFFAVDGERQVVHIRRTEGDAKTYASLNKANKVMEKWKQVTGGSLGKKTRLLSGVVTRANGKKLVFDVRVRKGVSPKDFHRFITEKKAALGIQKWVFEPISDEGQVEKADADPDSSSLDETGKKDHKLLQDAKDKLVSVKKMSDLGKVLGGTIDALVPGEGDWKRASIRLQVQPHPNVSLDLSLKITCSRSANGKINLRADTIAGAKGKMDVWLAKVFAQVQLNGFLSATAEDGKQAMDLVALALQQAVARVSQKAADHVWGEGFADDVRSNMDEDDSVQAGLKVTGRVGGSAKAVSDELSLYAAGSVAHTRTVTHTKDGTEKASKTDGMITFRVSTKLPGLGWTGRVSLQARTDFKTATGILSFDLFRNTNIEEFCNALDTGQFKEQIVEWVTSAGAVGYKIVSGKAGLEPSVGGGRKLGAAFQAMQAATPVASIAKGKMLQVAMAKVEGVSAMMRQQLNLRMTWSDGSVTLDIKLSKYSRVAVKGDVLIGSIQLAMENISELVKVPTITLL
jgi:hypothetical protein